MKTNDPSLILLSSVFALAVTGQIETECQSFTKLATLIASWSGLVAAAGTPPIGQ